MRNAYVRVQIGHDGLVVQFNGQTNFKVCYCNKLSPFKESLTAGPVNYSVGKSNEEELVSEQSLLLIKIGVFISFTIEIWLDTRLRLAETDSF